MKNRDKLDPKSTDLDTDQIRDLRDEYSEGASKAHIMGSACHGGGGATTSNVPGCSPESQ